MGRKAGGMGKEAAYAAGGGGEQKHGKVGDGKVVLEAPGSGIIVISLEFRLDDGAAFRTCVNFDECRAYGVFKLELKVGVGVESKAVVVQGLPDGIGGVGPGEQAERRRLACLEDELCMYVLAEQEMRYRAVFHVQGAFAAGVEGGMFRGHSEGLGCARAGKKEGKLRDRIESRVQPAGKVVERGKSLETVLDRAKRS